MLLHFEDAHADVPKEDCVAECRRLPADACILGCSWLYSKY